MSGIFKVEVSPILKSVFGGRKLYILFGLCFVQTIYFLGTTRLVDQVGWVESPLEITSTLTSLTGSFRDVTLEHVELKAPDILTTKEPLPVSQNIPINPPTLDSDLELWNRIQESLEVDLTLLSDLVQIQIQRVQSNCSGPTLKCGHHNSNGGIACQIHHRVTCLMLSYTLSIPLIHDETVGWIYTQRWSDLFVPLGSNCSEGPQTIHWIWDNRLYVNPMKDGLLVTEPLADFLNKKLAHPFHWLVGQFMKYALKFNGKIERDVKRDMAAIPFQRPIIGLHIRRTDKRAEEASSYHKIQEYMLRAEEDYQKLTQNLKTLLPNRTVFIASDDAATVVPQARKMYANWTVLGFPSQLTLKTHTSRKNASYEILRDIYILSECDYLICGFTSNVCGLLLEMLSFKHPDGYNLVKSLDKVYSYPLINSAIKPFKILGGNLTQFLKWPSKS